MLSVLDATASARQSYVALLTNITTSSGLFVVAADSRHTRDALIERLAPDLEIGGYGVLQIGGDTLSALELAHELSRYAGIAPPESRRFDDWVRCFHKAAGATGGAAANLAVIVEDADEADEGALCDLASLLFRAPDEIGSLRIVLVGSPRLREYLLRPNCDRLRQAMTKEWKVTDEPLPPPEVRRHPQFGADAGLASKKTEVAVARQLDEVVWQVRGGATAWPEVADMARFPELAFDGDSTPRHGNARELIFTCSATVSAMIVTLLVVSPLLRTSADSTPAPSAAISETIAASTRSDVVAGSSTDRDAVIRASVAVEAARPVALSEARTEADEPLSLSPASSPTPEAPPVANIVVDGRPASIETPIGAAHSNEVAAVENTALRTVDPARERYGDDTVVEASESDAISAPALDTPNTPIAPANDGAVVGDTRNGARDATHSSDATTEISPASAGIEEAKIPLKTLLASSTAFEEPSTAGALTETRSGTAIDPSPDAIATMLAADDTANAAPTLSPAPEAKSAAPEATDSARAIAPYPPNTAPEVTQSLPPEAIAILLRRGDESLKLHDIVAARLLYERAALAGSGRAARQIGRTYDPQFLAQIGERALPPDREKALEWYRRAAALGDAEAAMLLQK